MTFVLRKATPEDTPLLEQVIAESARKLGRPDYTDEQIEAALGSAFGVDSQLIRDGTYFVAESADDGIVGCGGWSWRKTLFGSDRQAGRQSEALDPRYEAARIRAFFVRPEWARRGIARALLEKCEEEARLRGFQSLELLATLPGHRLYQALGYTGEARVTYPLGNDVTIDFIPMMKKLR